MYTWGYIKDVTLAKLDLDALEANEQDLISRFPFYANEAMTQICSAVKPKLSYAQFNIDKNNIGLLKEMPDDFIAFSDDVNTRRWVDFNNDTWIEECHDDEVSFKGYNQLIFWKEGIYTIAYKARWYKFDKSLDDNVVINVPTDILECLPSYIASQCYKVDDETKSAIYRNEYELFLARIDDTDFKQTKTFKIGGDW